MIETLVEIEHKEDFSEQGFYSKTYIALDKRLNRDVAVKDIDAGVIESKESVEHYFEEAQKLSLAAHPRVLPVYFVGLNRNGDDSIGSPRIVTRFLQKGSLNKYLCEVYDENRTISLEQGIRFAHDIIQGMSHLHSLDILHLDLKASNVFIGDDNKLVIADFGQSKMLNDDGVVKIDNLYPSILTPENVKKKVADKTTDIYQFGVLLYSIFNYDIYRNAIEDDYQVNTEKLIQAFKSEDSTVELKKECSKNIGRLVGDIKAGNFPNRNLYHNYVPKVLQGIIVRCLEVDVKDRYQNFYDIQSELSKINLTNEAEEIYEDLESETIYFKKNDVNCRIEVEFVNNRYNTKVFRNNRAKTALNNSNLTRIQLSNEIEHIVNNV
jgi:serine/threonine protein kinase